MHGCGALGRAARINRRLTIRFKEQGLRIATPVTTVFNHVAHEPAPGAVRQGAVGEVASGQLAMSPPPAALGNTS